MQHRPGYDWKSLHEYNYSVCLHSKQHKLPNVVSQSRAEKYFDIIHIDLWGPSRSHALNRARYFFNNCR